MYIYMDPHVTFWGIEQAKLGSAVWKKKKRYKRECDIFARFKAALPGRAKYIWLF